MKITEETSLVMTKKICEYELYDEPVQSIQTVCAIVSDESDKPELMEGEDGNSEWEYLPVLKIYILKRDWIIFERRYEDYPSFAL